MNPCVIIRNDLPANVLRIYEVYSRLKSVWKTGEEIGLAGQTVHRFLKRYGLMPHWKVTEKDEETIKDFFSQPGRTRGGAIELAKEMGLSPLTICRHAKKLGIKLSRTLSEEEKIVGVDRLTKNREKNGHPRGSLGMKHSDEAKKKMSESGVKRWNNMSEEEKDRYSRRASINARKTFTNREGASWKCGWREIGGTRKYYRSQWEANYGRYLRYYVANTPKSLRINT